MKRFFSTLLGGLLLSATFTAWAAAPPIISWQPPTTFTPPHAAGRTGLIDISGPLPLVPMVPCRQYSSVGTPLLQGTPRAVTVTGAPCGVLSNSFAIAVNITVFNIVATSNAVFKVGTASPPTTAFINYPPTEIQRGNAGVISTNGTSIFVEVDQGSGQVDFVVDIYGYYPQNDSGHLLNPGEYFEIATSIAPPFASINARNNSTANGAIALQGIAGGASGDTIAILGTNSSSGGLSLGVEGFSTNGIGVKGISPANPLGSDFQAGVAGESSNSWGMFAKTNTGCNMVALRVSPANVFENEVDIGCTNATAASFFGTVNINPDTGGPGDLHVSGVVTKGSGSFKIDHPLDPENKYLYHSFVESPDMKNVYDGVVELNSRGEAVVVLPDYFEALNSDYRYQLTSIGRHAPIFIADEVGGNQFRIAGGRPGMRVSWQVTGIRKDAFANAHRIIPEVAKEPGMQGRYLHPLEWGQSLEKGPVERPQSRIIQESQQK
jgi:hypothetical protein